MLKMKETISSGKHKAFFLVTQNYLLNSLFQYSEIRCYFGKALKHVSFPTDFSTFNTHAGER